MHPLSARRCRVTGVAATLLAHLPLDWSTSSKFSITLPALGRSVSRFLAPLPPRPALSQRLAATVLAHLHLPLVHLPLIWSTFLALLHHTRPLPLPPLRAERSRLHRCPLTPSTRRRDALFAHVVCYGPLGSDTS
ncbi:hypothetical protein DFH07DRAFT_962987 [Mycena maculata]|uniref:Uncharacterized protein n=1 Tax=Mycena maculata TaxID=230809 RepID=A0AAD7N5K9_9AGAR|nr:hypothetical protein DFH07DRAFT_962987 [Mycena maculata]